MFGFSIRLRKLKKILKQASIHQRKRHRASSRSFRFAQCPRGESNTHQRLRSPLFYPLNYKGELGLTRLNAILGASNICNPAV